MTITNHRKIWISHNGPIPKDKNGISYDIHHIDGNKANNSIENLKCVTIQEHYDIHLKQGDWLACQAILARIDIDGASISKVASLAQRKRFESPEERNKARQRTYKQFSDPIKKLTHKLSCVNHRGTIWINDGTKNKRVTEKTFIEQFSTWSRGRLLGSVKFYEHNNRRRDSLGRFIKKEHKV